MDGAGVPEQVAPRKVEWVWNYSLIFASVAVSLLGAFTATQMMCQARTSRYFSGVLVWTILGSLTFGFCSVWSLHFIAMLACELDLRIGLNVPLTILSAILAVSFTFTALASDLLWIKWHRHVKRKIRKKRQFFRRMNGPAPPAPGLEGRQSTDALLGVYDSELGAARPLVSEFSHGRKNPHSRSRHRRIPLMRQNSGRVPLSRTNSARGARSKIQDHFRDSDSNMSPGLSEPSPLVGTDGIVDASQGAGQPSAWPFFQAMSDSSAMECSSMGETGDSESIPRSSTEDELSRRSVRTLGSESSSLGLPNFMSFKLSKARPSSSSNIVYNTVEALYLGATLRNIVKGFIWSLAITSMHYVGILALSIPEGYVTLNPWIVLLSALASWLVCTIGCILIPRIEVNLLQQLLFAVVAASGVAAMHFTGMRATTFWSRAPPTSDRGYPKNLAVAVSSIAILTCILANGLLAHSATVARNKLAEVVQTKRKLWAAIAQKENAEAAAAARSDFIASASHEIRTPLHQLQGYSDLLSRTELSDEGRLLLLAIQQATRSLSMITANVLDWSRLEKGEAVCRPTSLDIRKVCESIINILPNKDDEVETELMVVVTPRVPNLLFLDETYMQRILMNLLTNALKFTQTGYVLLLVDYKDGHLEAVVKDSGYGIPESFLPHLFEPFKQAQTRGAERGTGLGLAIIRQLLAKMQGTISVESTYQQSEVAGHGNSGSTFTIQAPVSTTSDESAPAHLPEENRQIAIFTESKERLVEGLRLAWQSYGFEVIPASKSSEILDSWGYIWTDLMFLRDHPELAERLLHLEKQLVLISYDSQLQFDKLLGSTPPAHIIPVRRPFLWHKIAESITFAINEGKSQVDRNVRFKPVVNIVEGGPSPDVPERTAFLRGSTVLLVEDNKINQRLGVKMLKILGYNVIIAENGQDAVEKLIAHDQEIDIILMDQSMPRKDGVTATKEIREMESVGGLSRRRPLIMVTAVVGTDAQAICMAAGADAFLPKPLALGKLEQTLKKYLG